MLRVLPIFGHFTRARRCKPMSVAASTDWKDSYLNADNPNAVMGPPVQPASPEFRALADKQHEENWAPYLEEINAKLIEAQTLRSLRVDV